MVIRQKFWIFWIYLTIFPPTLGSDNPPLLNSTIEEKLNKIKVLSGPNGTYYEDTIDIRLAIVWEINAISQLTNPEAVSALIDLVLYEGFDEYDAPLVGDSSIYRVSHNAVLALLDQPLTTPPVIRGSDYPDYPALSQPDPKRREGAFREFYGFEYQYALRDCRAWCQEVRDGKRTF